MRKRWWMGLIALLFAGLLAGCAAQPKEQQEIPRSMDDCTGKRIGVMTGTVQELLLLERFPDQQPLFFNNISDLAVALKNGLIDAFAADEFGVMNICTEIPEIDRLEEPLGTVDCAFAFGKTAEGKALQEEMDIFLAGLEADGTLASLREDWFRSDPVGRRIDIASLPADRGVLRVATTAAGIPFSYMMDNEVTGFDIDLLARFCRAKGYGLQLEIMNFPSVIPGLASGQYDIGANGIFATEERKESCYFSTPYVQENIVIAVPRDGAAAKSGFLASLEESFVKTFVREQRWKMVLQGLGTTAMIAALSVILGSALGFGLCMLRRTGLRFAIGFTTVFIRLLQGTPILVVLMILFYVVFAHTGFSAVIVAVIGFSLNFAAYACEILRTGMDAVPIGQTEAALASGYTRAQAFFSIVMPQAALHFLPVYRGEIVSLVKSTSIVGYIAIQDLTKVGDLIRSRTYEPFFPLLAIAFIYFLITWLLTLLLQRLEQRMKPDRKNRAVKGVKML